MKMWSSLVIASFCVCLVIADGQLGDVALEKPNGGAPLHISLMDLVRNRQLSGQARSMRSGRSLLIDGKEVELTPSLGYMLGGMGIVTAAGAGYLLYKDAPFNLPQGRSKDDGLFTETGLIKLVLTLGMLEDFYKKYDMWNIECHKRSLCELHHRLPQLQMFTRISRAMIDWPIFRDLVGLPRVLPSAVKVALDDIMNACWQGAAREDCGSIYSKCTLSIDSLFEHADNVVNKAMGRDPERDAVSANNI